MSSAYPHIGRIKHPVNAAFWERCYRNGEIFWDHHEPSPGLLDFLAEHKPRAGRILVPGCGLGHDCRALARFGYGVTGIDISPAGVAAAKQLANDDGLKIHYVVGDCLNLAPRFRGKFDWLLEHTCFCAIDPGLRDRYVRSVTAALKRNGRFLGLFYNIQPRSGPPFGTTRNELIERFSPHFSLELEQVPRSWPNRKGKELLMLWRKKSTTGAVHPQRDASRASR